jgi:hypothetical protein
MKCFKVTQTISGIDYTQYGKPEQLVWNSGSIHSKDGLNAAYFSDSFIYACNDPNIACLLAIDTGINTSSSGWKLWCCDAVPYSGRTINNKLYPSGSGELPTINYVETFPPSQFTNPTINTSGMLTHTAGGLWTYLTHVNIFNVHSGDTYNISCLDHNGTSDSIFYTSSGTSIAAVYSGLKKAVDDKKALSGAPWTSLGFSYNATNIEVSASDYTNPFAISGSVVVYNSGTTPITEQIINTNNLIVPCSSLTTIRNITNIPDMSLSNRYRFISGMYNDMTDNFGYGTNGGVKNPNPDMLWEMDNYYYYSNPGDVIINRRIFDFIVSSEYTMRTAELPFDIVEIARETFGWQNEWSNQ